MPDQSAPAWLALQNDTKCFAAMQDTQWPMVGGRRFAPAGIAQGS